MIVLLALLSLLIAGCTVDTNDNGSADVAVDRDGDTVEVTVDMEDVAVEDVPKVADFCIAGQTYTYDSPEGNVDSKIIGMTTYKGKSFCQAEATSEIDSPIGAIKSETTYYFDNTYKEMWVVTTVSNPAMPEPQTTEIHIQDGKVD